MTFDLKTGIIKKLKDAPKQKRREEMQVSPSGMAAASQAVPGEFDSRHLLQKEKCTLGGAFLFLEIDRILTRVEGGAVLREQNALPYGIGVRCVCWAKSAIDNCRAGRAAKGATLVTI